MQHFETTDDGNLAVFFYGAIFNIIANVESVSFGEYAIKAVIGGLVWIAFKLLGDWMAHRFNIHKRDDK
jgi:hypothetical protein